MTSHSENAIASASKRAPEGRTWVLVFYDQLSDEIGPLARLDPEAAGIVLIESRAYFRRRPYHKQRIALLIANQRQFAREQAERGVAVRYVRTDESFRKALGPITEDLGPLLCMVPAELETRIELEPLIEDGRVRTEPHGGWITTPEDFRQGAGDPPWLMDSFYRHVRKTYGFLMEGRKYAGGKLSFDHENREPWSGDPPAPEPPAFEPDAITREVADLIARDYAEFPGEVDLAALPATRADAEACWAWAKAECMRHFGAYEDAMSTKSSTVFHTRLSALINLHRLLPLRVAREAEGLDIPLNSKEGFIRQIVGWREYMRHVHERTDGFRVLVDGTANPCVAVKPGDGGWGRWTGKAWPYEETCGGALDGGAEPTALERETPLPPAYWGVPSGLNCLDSVVADVWREAYSHHITRLMVLSNIATLLDVSPRELTDWFLVAYWDSYDWVTEPNVLGMGTYGMGQMLTTKPYVSGSNYLDNMSDYCGSCAFDPQKSCPIRFFYWAFLARHEGSLRGVGRLNRMYASLDRRGPGQRAEDGRVFERARDLLIKGNSLTPEAMAGELTLWTH
ncbi:MAG: cryptochrome/photolyase family protein [Sumerlaeia bacterium]